MTTPNAATITATNLGKTFPHGPAVLDDISFSIRPSEFVAIVGPSGCGKSTLLRMLAGLETPDRGTLSMTTGDQPGRTAFVFQEPALLPWRSVAANITLPLELDHAPKTERAARLRESLCLIGLTDADARKRPRQLSGGMRMRVSLARALVTKPSLLLLDEPFAALDDILRQRLNEDLRRLWSEQRWTALFVTHNVAEAVFLADRILIMSSHPGRIAANIPIPFGPTRTQDLRTTPNFSTLVSTVTQSLRTTLRD